MIRKPALSAEKYATLDELVRLGGIAVKEAQDESRRLGVPNVFSINGRLYYESPQGELSATDPGVHELKSGQEPKTDQPG